jgi:hypothetical protein
MKNPDLFIIPNRKNVTETGLFCKTEDSRKDVHQ